MAVSRSVPPIFTMPFIDSIRTQARMGLGDRLGTTWPTSSSALTSSSRLKSARNICFLPFVWVGGLNNNRMDESGLVRIGSFELQLPDGAGADVQIIALAEIDRLIQTAAGIRIQITNFDDRTFGWNSLVRRDRYIADADAAGTVQQFQLDAPFAAVGARDDAGRLGAEFELELRATTGWPARSINRVIVLKDDAFFLLLPQLGQKRLLV